MNLSYLNSGKNIPPELHAWARRLIDDLSRGPVLPQFTDDTAAAAASYPINGEYYDDTGVRRRRIA